MRQKSSNLSVMSEVKVYLGEITYLFSSIKYSLFFLHTVEKRFSGIKNEK